MGGHSMSKQLESRATVDDVAWVKSLSSYGDVGDRPLGALMASLQHREVVAALKRAGGSRRVAAELLQISRSRLYRLIDTLGIKSDFPYPGHAR